jgi:transposase, IS4 family protein
VVFIYRQEIIKDISFFTSQPQANFYNELFMNLDLSCIPEYNSKTDRTGYSNHAMICAFIVMKCEGFSQISDLLDFLSNNLIIAYYCGFNVMDKLPSYAKFTRFIREFDNDVLQTVMQSQVLKAVDLTLVDPSFIALDATPVKANVSNNNPKSFKKDKFSKNIQPKADKDCRLGVQTASNQHDEKNYEFYWGYKNHILVDCISGLPICELTTGANVSDSSVTLDMLKDDYRLSIDRSSIAFKAVYALRTEIERYNSRFKQAGCERVFVRNGNSVKNLNTLAHISLLSVAIAAVVTKKDVSYRSIKTLKRLA